jgi:hypothetical protein
MKDLLKKEKKDQHPARHVRRLTEPRRDSRSGRQIKYQHLGVLPVIELDRRFISQQQRVAGLQGVTVHQ